MANPPKWRKNDVNKPVTNNVIGYISEIQDVSTKQLYQPKLSNNYTFKYIYNNPAFGK